MARIIVVLFASVAVLVGTITAAAAGGGGHGGVCDGFGFGSELSMLDGCFQATAHFVEAGTTLTVRNDGQIGHTITAVDGSFDSGMVRAGETYELRLDEPGVIRIYCEPHGTPDGNGMAGVLVVGQPTPESAGAAELAATLQRTLNQQNQTLSHEVQEQIARMDKLQAGVRSLSGDVRNLRKAVQDGQVDEGVAVLGAADLNQTGVTIPLLVGLALGIALSAVYVGRRLLSTRE